LETDGSKQRLFDEVGLVLFSFFSPSFLCFSTVSLYAPHSNLCPDTYRERERVTEVATDNAAMLDRRFGLDQSY
jgi:hypothetical protein